MKSEVAATCSEGRESIAKLSKNRTLSALDAKQAMEGVAGTQNLRAVVRRCLLYSILLSGIPLVANLSKKGELVRRILGVSRN